MTSADFLRDLVKDLKHKEDVSVLADGLGSAEFTGYMDTGCLALNVLVSGSLVGGVPNNSCTAFVGDPQTGKTFLILGILRGFLQGDDQAIAALYDTESAIRTMMAHNRGIDTNRVIRGEPETLQDFRTKVLDLLLAYAAKPKATRPPLLTILDSLGLLSSAKEMADSIDGKDTRDMTRAQLIRGCFRVLRLKLAKLQVPMLITNHVTAGIGQYVPAKVISGGSGLLYAADTIIMLSKSKDREGTEVVGNIIKAKTYKSRLSRADQEVELNLSYDTGLDKWYGLRQIAEQAGLFKKVSTKIELPDGRKVYGKEVDENPEEVYTPEVLDHIEKYANQRYRYGSDNAAAEVAV